MNKRSLGVALSSLIHLSVLFGAKQPKALITTTIDDIPQMCANIMAQLLAQDAKEIHNETGFEFQYKLLPTQHMNDCKICALLNGLSKFKYNLDTDAGTFRNTESSGYFEAIRIWLPQRGMAARDEVEQFVQARPISPSPELITPLLSEYEKVIEHVKNGWVQSNTKPSGKIKPPAGENWTLFIKNEGILNEAKFITELIKKFNLEGHIYCRENGYATYKEMVYLWVEKNALQEFDRFFKFMPLTGQLQ